MVDLSFDLQTFLKATHCSDRSNLC
jgi:hypothetical protein